MQAAMRWISLALFTVLGLFLVWFGATYATVHDMLWFHAAAVPETAREAVRPLYLALMSLIGGASLALGLLGLFMTWTAMRRSGAGAAFAIALAYAIAFVTAALTAEKLARVTGAPTSWHIMGVLLALTAAGLLAHGLARRPRS